MTENNEGRWELAAFAAVVAAVCLAIASLIVSRPHCDRDNEGSHRDGFGHRPHVCRCVGTGVSDRWRCDWEELPR